MAISFEVKTTSGIHLINIDEQVKEAMASLGATDGILTVFCPHSTAGITINENADPDVQHDWAENMKKLVPANQSYYQHMEGNSHSHVLSSLIGASEQVIVQDGQMMLGTWQSLYFAEFDGPRSRYVYVEFTANK